MPFSDVGLSGPKINISQNLIASSKHAFSIVNKFKILPGD